MHKSIALIGFAAALALPAAALADPSSTTAPASTVSTAGTSGTASQIAPGTYTVKVVAVVDPKHVVVTLDNGTKTTLIAGRPTVDFSKLQANDSVKVSVDKGSVLVFLDMTTH